MEVAAYQTLQLPAPYLHHTRTGLCRVKTCGRSNLTAVAVWLESRTTLQTSLVVSCPCKDMFVAPKPTPSLFNQVVLSLLPVQIECRLCLTVHNNEGNYLAHTQVRYSLALTC